MLDIHNCLLSSEENARLSRQVRRLREKLGQLKLQISDLNEGNQNSEKGTIQKNVCEKCEFHERNSKRLLALHNSATRRYQAETRTVSNLKTNIEELESQLITSQRRSEKFATRIHELEDSHNSIERKNIKLEKLSADLKKSNDKLKRENDALRMELDGLDSGFFDDIERLKTSLYESTNLNDRYEKTLRKVCQQAGYKVPSL